MFTIPARRDRGAGLQKDRHCGRDVILAPTIELAKTHRAQGQLWRKRVKMPIESSGEDNYDSSGKKDRRPPRPHADGSAAAGRDQQPVRIG
ncbi:MAG TPA: hypothetical protein VNV38_18920 [Stellaceae bacterium]|nr:hypothetical protein [Stellaceae bacterium]